MASKLKYFSTKTFTHAQGLSCCFRQWRAKDSHCRFIHGYAIEVKLTFEGELDERNWVQDFGGLKDVKQFLSNTFDHRLLVARDDPYLKELLALDRAGVVRVMLVDHTGCERFAEFIFRQIEEHLPEIGQKLAMVEVREHEGNSAIVMRDARG